MIADLIHGKIDILLISETKVDSTFPTPQFKYTDTHTSPFRLSQYFGKIKCIILEINISNKRWLLLGLYNPNKSMTSNHLMILSKNLNHLPWYDNIILLGAFNSETSKCY